MPALRCGADRLGEYAHLFKDARVGLVTTPTGRTSDGRSTIAALQEVADLRGTIVDEVMTNLAARLPRRYV